MTLRKALEQTKTRYGDMSKPVSGPVRISRDILDRVDILRRELGVPQRHLVDAFLLMCVEKFEGRVTPEDRAYFA